MKVNTPARWWVCACKHAPLRSFTPSLHRSWSAYCYDTYQTNPCYSFGDAPTCAEGGCIWVEQNGTSSDVRLGSLACDMRVRRACLPLCTHPACLPAPTPAAVLALPRGAPWVPPAP